MSKKPPDIESIADLALGEIAKRFEDRPSDIPDHVLAKYFTDVNKVIDRRSEKEAEEESRPFVLLDELPTLPRARAQKLLRDEISRLTGLLNEHRNALRELDYASQEPETAESPVREVRE